MRRLDLFLSLFMIVVVLLVSACAQLQPVPATGPSATVPFATAPSGGSAGSATAVPSVGSVGSGTASVGGTVEPVTPGPAATSEATIPAGGGQVVTLADQGKTIHLKVGESFLLKLGSDTYNWQVNISDQNVVSLVKGVMVIRGAQGLFEGRQPGTATLTATGDPQCRQSTPPCMLPSIMFQVNIVVDG